jgi:hypothetical protein
MGEDTETDGGAEARSAPPAGGEAAEVRLDKRTHLDRKGYRASFIDYGDGLAEVGFGFTSTGFPNKTPRGLSEKRDENEDRSVRRARKLLRQRLLASGATYLLTLTYQANVTDLGKANDDLTVFLRRVKRRIPGYVYVAVAERQKRGAWHWHLAVNGWQDHAFLRNTWRSVVGEGNIDIKAPRAPKGHPRLGLVKYLCKYLSKSFAEEEHLNARRFRSSRISVPEVRQLLPVGTSDAARTFCQQWLERIGGATNFFVYCEHTGSGWGCTW